LSCGRPYGVWATEGAVEGGGHVGKVDACSEYIRLDLIRGLALTETVNIGQLMLGVPELGGVTVEVGVGKILQSLEARPPTLELWWGREILRLRVS